MVQISQSSPPNDSRMIDGRVGLTAKNNPSSTRSSNDDMSISSGESSNQELPVLTTTILLSVDDEAQLEKVLISHLDDDITSVEEKALMLKLNDDIVASEEKYLLNKLAFLIDYSELKEKTEKDLGSRVDYVLSANDEIPEDDDGSDSSLDVDLAKSADLDHQEWGWPELLCKGIDNVEKPELYRATKVVPKYFGSPSHPLITQEAFRRRIIAKVDKHLSSYPERAQDRVSLNMTLLEADNDPDAYLLVATGSRKALDDALSIASKYIYHQLGRYNMRLIISDERSVCLDIRVGVREKLGLKIIRYEGSHCDLNDQNQEDGVWVQGIANPAGPLASVLRSAAIDDGAVIMSVDGERCRSPQELTALISRAQTRESDSMMTISCYLSKFADLSHIVNPDQYNLRLKNGLPYVKLERQSVATSRPDPVELRKKALKICREILADPASVELDIILSPQEDLGAKVTADVETPEITKDVMIISHFTKNGQLERILGKNACRTAAVIVEADGRKKLSLQVLKDVKDQAQERNINFRMRIIFLDGTDLSGIDKSKLDTGLINPRRRNNKNPYPPWTWYEPDDIRQKRSNGDSLSMPPSKVAKTVRTSSSHQSSFNMYNHFKNKYKQLISNEYREIGIPVPKTSSIMWQQHKKMYGEDAACDDKCKCITELKKLTQHVASSVPKNQLRDNGQPVGFVKHFVPRFLPRLQKEYPTETSSQLLYRLSDMWDAHKKNRILGMTCKKNCQCDEYWEIIFGKGDPSRAPKQKKAPRRNGDSGPSKKKPRNSANPIVETDSNKGAVSQLLPRKTVQNKSTNELRKSYVVKFNANKPLGAYFVTGRTQAGSAKCKIYSIWEKGEAKKDARIRSGTIVESVDIGDGPVRISSYPELRIKYHEAKDKNSTIKLSMINLDITGTASAFARDWTSAGKWQGTATNGWHGGAGLRIEPKLKVPESRTETIHGQPNPVVQPPSGQTGTVKLREDKVLETAEKKRSSEPIWTAQMSEEIPSHRHIRPSRSVLRAKQKGQKPEEVPGQKPKKVTFAQKFDERFFCKERMASEHTVRSSAELATVNSNLQESLHDAIQHKKSEDVIRILEDGPSSSTTNLDTLNTQYEKVKETLSAVKEYQLQNKSNTLLDASLEEKEKDLSDKKIVLKVYINCTHLIPKAFSLKGWKAFKIQLQSISLKMVPRGSLDGRSKVLSGRVRVKKPGGALEDRGALPVRTLSEHIIYDEAEPFTVSNNLQLEQEKRFIVVDIEVGLPTDSVLPTKLGQFTLDMNRIHEICQYSEEWKTIEEPFQPNEFVERGEIAFSACKVPLSPQDIKARQDDVGRRLNEQLENISRFNQDHQHSHRKLTTNIRGPDNVSILHAAIELRRPDLVTRMVQLGARPTTKSPKGSPLAYAQTLRDRVYEKKMKALHERPTEDQQGTAEDQQITAHDDDRDSVRDKVLDEFETIISTLRESDQPSQRNKEQALGNEEVSFENTLSGHNSTLGIPAESIANDRNANMFGTSSSSKSNLSAPSPRPSSAAREGSIVSEMEARAVTNIIRNARPSDGGGDGQRALKSHVGDRLRHDYPEVVPGAKEAMRDLFHRLISSGMLIETGRGAHKILRLSNPPTTNVVSSLYAGQRATDAGGALREDRSTQNPGSLPILPNSDWYMQSGKVRCRDFNKGFGCTYGLRCKYLHVHGPIGEVLDDNELFSRSFPLQLDPQTLTFHTVGGWSTAAYYDREKRLVYYAERGPSGILSNQRIWWYPSKMAAEEAIRRAVIATTYRI